MYRILLFLLLLSVQSMAQSPIRPKLSYEGCHKKAIAEYIKEHPENVLTLKGEKVIFVKKQRFVADYQDSLSGVMIRTIDIDSSADLLNSYFPKKQKFMFLDLRQMVMRELNGYIWIMPVKVNFNGKKGLVEEKKYIDELCEYLFDYTPDRDQYYMYKSGGCKKV